MDTPQLIRCAYCHSERPREQMKPGKIVFRSRKFDSRKGRSVAFIDEKTNLYCTDKPCHGHDQMAHEG